MGYIDNTKQQLQNKIEDLTKKLNELEILNKDIFDFSNLAQSKTDLATLLKILPGAIYQTSASVDRDVIYISSQAHSLFGYTMDDMVGEKILQQVFNEDKEINEEKLNKAIEDKLPYQMEYRIKSRDGNIKWVFDQGVGVFNSEGNIKWFVGFIYDITDQVQTKSDREEVERRLYTLIENLRGVVYRCKNDSQWTMDYLSEGCIDLTGYRTQELVSNKNKSWQDIIYPDDRQKVHDIVSESLERKEPFQLTYRIVTSDNKIKYVWEQGQAVTDESGDILALEGFISDITEKVKSLELYESESDFNNMLIDNSPGYIITTDTSGIITSINDSLLNDLGKQEKDLLGKHFIGDYIPEDQKEPMISELRKIIKNKKPRHAESSFIDKTGKLIQVEWLIKPLHKDNELYAIYAFGINVTHQKEEEKRKQQILEMEKALAKASAKLIKANPNLNKVLKILGKAISADRAYIFSIFDNGKKMSNTFEYCRKGVPPQLDTLQNLDATLFPWFMNTMKRNENIEITDVSSLSEELKVLREYLEAQNIKSLLIVPLFMKNKGLAGFIGFDDISKTREWTHYEVAVLRLISEMIVNYYNRKEYEEKILEAKDEAERSERLKSEFLAQMSHEIRTPINVMMSFTSLLQEKYSNEKVDDETQLGFRAINKAGKRLIRTIDLLLNVSELQAGSYDYQPRVIDLNIDIVHNLIPEFTELAKNKNLKFSTSYAKGSDYDIFADEYTVHQIIANLIDNAIKYTEKGEILVNVALDELGRSYVEVSDTGIGITKKYLPKLFHEFTQEDIGYTRKFEGSGLGLALVKKYCDLNKAEISINSKKGSGSTFRVTFPKYEERWDST